ncbi:MAG: hypothetical protein AAFX50_16755 [Acidobacteriota bacterium]
MSLCREDTDAVAYLATFRRTADDVARAKRVASRMLREAINTHYVCPESLADFPASATGAEIRDLVGSHGLALAAYELSSKGKAAVSKKVAMERNSAKGWSDKVRRNELDLTPLQRRAAGGSSGSVQRLAVVGDKPPRVDPEVFKAWAL